MEKNVWLILSSSFWELENYKMKNARISPKQTPKKKPFIDPITIKQNIIHLGKKKIIFTASQYKYHWQYTPTLFLITRRNIVMKWLKDCEYFILMKWAPKKREKKIIQIFSPKWNKLIWIQPTLSSSSSSSTDFWWLP